MLVKKLVFSLSFLLFCFACQAQLENTKWAGKLMIPTEVDCYFHFKKDTLILYVADGDQEVEVMNYKVSKDTVKILKLYGNSPCTDDVTGIYTMKLDGDKLKLIVVTDDCVERSNAFVDAELIKMKTVEAIKPKE